MGHTRRVIDTPLSEQAFTSFATGAAMSGQRPVAGFSIPSLLYLVFEQTANQAHKFSLMTGGQVSVPVTYIVPGSRSRSGMASQDRPVGPRQPRGLDLALEHGDLMAQDQDLRVLCPVKPGEQGGPAEHTEQR